VRHLVARSNVVCPPPPLDLVVVRLRYLSLQKTAYDSDIHAREGMHIVDRKTISIMKACELVGVSRRTIYNWMGSGKVEYVRTAGGSVRIFTDTLWRPPHQARTTPASIAETTRTSH
jgi:excisionase family DNA binding protein